MLVAKLTDYDRNFIHLILRSPDLGDGWRQVSSVAWPLIDRFQSDALIEKDEVNLLVRLTEKGDTVAEYVA